MNKNKYSFYGIKNDTFDAMITAQFLGRNRVLIPFLRASILKKILFDERSGL